MSRKVCFMLRAEPSPTDTKTSVIHLYAFQLLDDEDDSTVYAIPGGI